MTRSRWLVIAAASLAAALSLLYGWWAWRSASSAPPESVGVPAPTGTPPPIDPRVLDHFLATAFDHDAPTALHKWTGDVRIVVTGSPSADDQAEVKDLVRDLRPLLGRIDLSVVEEEADANLEIRFLPLDEIGAIEPDHVRKELGHVRTWTDESGAVERARILIATGGTIQQYMRTHLIQDLGARALGLPGRPEGPYESPLASQPNWMVQSLPPLDRDVVALLYRDDLRPGMSRREVLVALGVPAAADPLTGTPGTRRDRGAGSSAAGSGS